MANGVTITPKPDSVGTKQGSRRERATGPLMAYLEKAGAPRSVVAMLSDPDVKAAISDDSGNDSNFRMLLSKLTAAGKLVRTKHPPRQAADTRLAQSGYSLPQFVKRAVPQIPKTHKGKKELERFKALAAAQERVRERVKRTQAARLAALKARAAARLLKKAGRGALKGNARATIMLHLEGRDIGLTAEDARRAYQQLRELWGE